MTVQGAGNLASLRIGAGGSAAFAFTASRKMSAWLGGQDMSLAFTTYDVGKIFLIGVGPDGQLAFCERSFPRPMGLGVHANGFWAGTLH